MAGSLANMNALRTYLAGHNAASQLPAMVPPPPILHHLQQTPAGAADMQRHPALPSESSSRVSEMHGAGCLAGGSLSQTLPGIAGQLRIPSPTSSTASLKVTAPNGISVTVEEAMAHLGMSTSPQGPCPPPSPALEAVAGLLGHSVPTTLPQHVLCWPEAPLATMSVCLQTATK